MSQKKLFVGGLAWATTDQGLRSAFEAFGTVVEAKVVTDRETGRSRGFGFVSYEEDGATDAAIDEMNGVLLDGRSIKVDHATQKPRTGGGGGGGWGGGRSGGRDRW